MCSEVLVKEGLSRQFITLVFQTWLSEKNIGHISSALRKAQLEARLTVSRFVLYFVAIAGCLMLRVYYHIIFVDVAQSSK